MTAASQADLEVVRAAYIAAVNRDTNPLKLSDVFPVPDDLDARYAGLTRLKTLLDGFRPFDPHQIDRLHEVFDTEFTYQSNRIEGNTLTLRETDLVVNKGITIGGKSVREHLEAVNHAEAVTLIRTLADRNVPLTERVVLDLHALVMRGVDTSFAGRYREERVRIVGSQHVPPNHLKVLGLMTDLFTWIETEGPLLHPVRLAAEVHEKLVTIHPFRDGNGRTARLVMNLILLRHGYPVTIISGDRAERQSYYETLEAAQISQPVDNTAFQRLIAQIVHRWLLTYLEFASDSSSESVHGKGADFFAAVAPHVAHA